MTKACLVLLAILAASCQYDPFAHRLLTQKPRPGDVVGIYVFEEQTVDYNAKIKSRGRIRINADGTFDAQQIPRFRAGARGNFMYSNTVSLKGKWSIDSFGAVSNGMDTAVPTYGISLEGGRQDLEPATFSGDKKPDGLIFEFGDPDEGKALIFRKL